MLFGPIGGLVGGIIGALKGGDLFNQNTYSQQMYNNLTLKKLMSVYTDLVEFYKDTINLVFWHRTLGTIANNLAKNPNMSSKTNAYRTAADKYISGIDPIKQGYSVTRRRIL
jgi:hypothetical protein